MRKRNEIPSRNVSDAPDDDGNSHPETESDLHCGTVLPVGGLRGNTGACSFT